MKDVFYLKEIVEVEDEYCYYFLFKKEKHKEIMTKIKKVEDKHDNILVKKINHFDKRSGLNIFEISSKSISDLLPYYNQLETKKEIPLTSSSYEVWKEFTLKAKEKEKERLQDRMKHVFIGMIIILLFLSLLY